MHILTARVFRSSISILILLLLGTSLASAQREIAPEPIPPHPVIQRDLTLTDMRVDIKIDGSIAHTTIRQTLRNDGSIMAEGKYMLPLPPGASVSDFAIVDGDQRLTGEVLDADEARQVYQDIVRKMRDPGLLEYQDSNTFSVAVFPFNPGDSRTIEVSFNETLAGTGQLQSYYLPLRWAGWSYCRDVSFVLNYDIDSRYELGTITSPTHGITVNRDGDHRARGSFEERLSDFTTDFALHIGRRTSEFAASLTCFPSEGGEDGYFLLSLLAALPQNDEYMPKDVLFVFDKSGSMAGEKIEQAKGALRFVLERLKRDDHFGLIYYDDVIYKLWDELHTASEDNIREARENVERLEDGGSTDINEALRQGADMMKESSRPQYVIFLTDGLPTAGECDIDNIINNAKAQFNKDVKMFVFGVGYDVNTTLLDSLSYNHHGSATYVGPNEDIEVKVSEFYAKMSSPALVDIALEFDGLNTYDVMPRELPDLFHNHEIHITGRFRGTPSNGVHVTLLGDNDNGRQKFMENVDSNLSTANNTVPRLWATRKVSYLLDQIRLHGDDQELLDEVDKLAMRFGIVTPYTSYLITEPQAYFDADMRQRSLGVEMEEARMDQSGALAVGRSSMNQANQAADAAAAPQGAGKAAGGTKVLIAEDELSSLPAWQQELLSDPAWNQPYIEPRSIEDIKSSVNYINSQTFVLQLDRDEKRIEWIDARYEPDRQEVIQVTSYGDTYFQLLNEFPELGDYFSQGGEVTVVVGDDLALQTVPDEVSNTSAEISRLRTALGQGDYLSKAGPDSKVVAGRFDYFPDDNDSDDALLLAASTSGGGGGGGRRALVIVAIGAGVFALASAAGIAGWVMLKGNEHYAPPNGPETTV